MAYIRTVSSEMKDEAVAAIASGSFSQVFGNVTLAQALRNPLAMQSTKVRRAIKESYRKEVDEYNSMSENQNFEDKNVDDSNNGSGVVVDDPDDSGALDGFSEEDITIVIDGVASVKTFLIKTPSTTTTS